MANIIKREGNYFVQYVRDRIRRNKNCIIIIVGETGSGPYWAALAIAESIDPTFTWLRVAFNAEQFIRLVKSDDLPKKGAAIIFDEGGVSMNARRFMSQLNILLSHTFQTIRYKNQIIIITVPDLSFIDIHTRKLAHILIRTDGINKSSKTCRLRPYCLITNPMQGDKIFRPHPALFIGGRRIKISRILVHKPTFNNLRGYEKIKRKFGDDLLNAAYNKMAKKDPATELSTREQEIFDAAKWGLTPEQLSKKLKISRERVYNIRTQITRKGFRLPDYQQKSVATKYKYNGRKAISSPDKHYK